VYSGKCGVGRLSAASSIVLYLLAYSLKASFILFIQGRDYRELLCAVKYRLPDPQKDCRCSHGPICPRLPVKFSMVKQMEVTLGPITGGWACVPVFMVGPTVTAGVLSRHLASSSLVTQ
jgi:hypothetical protein